jgi:uncharacterized protein YjgD (DUF1641 family)
MVRRFLVAWAALAALPAFAQDIAKLKISLKQAIDEASQLAAKSTVDQIVAAQSREAVEALLWGAGQAKKRESELEGERPAIEKRVEAGQKELNQVVPEYQKAFREYMADQTNAEKQTRYRDLSAKMQEARQKVAAAQGELRALDLKIRNVAAIRGLILNALRAFDSDEAFQFMIAQLRTSGDWAVRAGIAAALEKIDRPEALDALIQACRVERDTNVLVAIVDAIAGKGQKTEATLGALTGALKDPAWQVKFAALVALKKLKAVEGIDAIIDAMAGSEGKLQYDFQETLIALTGVDKGIMPAAWRAWFDQNRQAVLAGTYEPRVDERPAAGGGAMTFFGIPVKSTRVVFVLDRSGSMAQPADWIPEIGTGDGLPKELREPAGRRKIDVARWQLKKVLHLMPDGAVFNLVFYNGSFEVFKDRLIKLNKRSREEAYKYIDGLDPTGATNIFDSVERAMQFAVGKDGRLTKEGPDTIYLLSDGMPNQGKYTRGEDILREIGKLNEPMKLAINTVWVGTLRAGGGGGLPGIGRLPDPDAGGEELMEKLAEQNHGRFVSTSKKNRDK